MRELYKITLFLFFFGLNQISSQILDPIDFGFEETSIADWTQTIGFTEETSIVASGLKSMKATLHYPLSNSPKLQTYRNSGTSNGTFALTEGNYNATVMVYLEGEVPSGLIISPTAAPVFPTFTLDGVAKNQWVKLTVPFTVALGEEQLNNWVIIQFTGLPSSGSGTVYIDDIKIEPEINEVIPYVSKIETIENAFLNLDTGKYNLALNVWVDADATMSSFHTYIDEPFTVLKWDLTDVPKDQWVALNQDFVLETPAVNSNFKIQVNNSPEYGGGKGTFYIDGISVTNSALLITESTLGDIKIFPNPAKDLLNVWCPVNSKITIYSVQGNEINSITSTKDHFELPILNLSKGIYIIKFSFDGQVSTRKLVVE
ncbi:hypothetical protein AXE80_02900 [Wenyingzhuangia fucanilytica]|uniref:Secretion system C-terminal sorting domain-containing protein n=1 Tax=Wenyingzhuangia fucanilytica TaxID=1790137 RepID=A0A1B1Y3H0_9FLAO|nr:T9SS type A sorting domain-containing protein [Wenyingzhuangia fucanilytica]ANW95297.1 hypothetical protein AXE80_02900 [Wenyingzhuangia fucanilytica]